MFEFLFYFKVSDHMMYENHNNMQNTLNVYSLCTFYFETDDISLVKVT